MTVVDTYINMLKKIISNNLKIELPAISDDILNTDEVGRNGYYDDEQNEIRFHYSYYINAFKEIADKVKSGIEIDENLECFKTPNCLALGLILIHEFRHFYQKKHFADVPQWEIDFAREKELSITKNSSEAEKREYTNLDIEIDAKCYAAFQLGIIFKDKELIDFEYPDALLDKEKYDSYRQEFKNIYKDSKQFKFYYE